MKKKILHNTFILGFIYLLTTTAFADIPQKDFDSAMDQYLSNDANVDKILTALSKYTQRKEEKERTQQLESKFDNPVKIDIGNSPVKGPADAKITIIEFSDFQCPFCKRGKDTMGEVLKAYPTQVKVVFKNLPLPFHDQAKPAAKAALAAGKQGKFWEMHDMLFNNQGDLNDDGYLKFAEKIGLNIDTFKKDLASEELDKQIEEDSALASKHGVQGTPGFFVNGVQVIGAQPFGHFKDLIDRWLKKLESGEAKK